MPSKIAHHTSCEDVWVDHPNGRIFARIWRSVSGQSGSVACDPIVLFHDSLGCVDLWRSFPARLGESTGKTVIAYDRLGYGRSGQRDGKPQPDFVSDEAGTYFSVIREQLGFNRFIALGHSIGGGMALACAARFADACAAVITESAQAFVEDRTVQGILEAKERFQQDGQIARLKKYHGDKAEWVLDAWTGTWLDPEFATWSLEALLPSVICPVLAIHGEHDEYGSIRHPQTIAELSSGQSRIEIIPHTRHIPHREREQTIVDLIKDFVDSL